jgi:hypothetical protein
MTRIARPAPLWGRDTHQEDGDVSGEYSRSDRAICCLGKMERGLLKYRRWNGSRRCVVGCQVGLEDKEAVTAFSVFLGRHNLRQLGFAFWLYVSK